MSRYGEMIIFRGTIEKKINIVLASAIFLVTYFIV